MNLEDRYGSLDRLMHRLAFSLMDAQHALGEVEDRLYRETLAGVELKHPVFVSGLPRSGTTILLELLWNSGRFASHTYRDVPFVLCPLFWQRFARRFMVEDEGRERAHGDGLEVSRDSPEAFEEMLWKRFWPSHYRDDRIEPWTSGDRDPEFDAFLQRNMRKVVMLRRDGPSDHRRYLSKNNANVARLAALPEPVRRGIVLVPFRDPLQHAASLLRQHRRFLSIHERDRFVLRYMEALGHHEFGKGLRPVDYGGWLDGASEPEELAFWVQYWVATYRHVREHLGAPVVLLSYEALTREPRESLERLAGTLGLPEPALTGQAERLHPPRAHATDRAAVPRGVLHEADELYRVLEAAAAV